MAAYHSSGRVAVESPAHDEPRAQSKETVKLHALSPVRCAGAMLLMLAVAAVSPAFAQRDFSGEWGALYHEDQPHRIPGPDLGDYTGIPLIDAARLRADSWD